MKPGFDFSPMPCQDVNAKYESFSLFFDDDIIHFIQSESKKYAHQNNRLNFLKRLPQ